MTRPRRIEVNCTTGEQIEVELTDEEIIELEAVRKASQKDLEERMAQAQALAEAKASAIAKLAALGLTEEEAAAIAGA